eukprot:5361262-Amphidinium_carterae.1
MNHMANRRGKFIALYHGKAGKGFRFELRPATDMTAKDVAASIGGVSMESPDGAASATEGGILPPWQHPN